MVLRSAFAIAPVLCITYHGHKSWRYAPYLEDSGANKGANKDIKAIGRVYLESLHAFTTVAAPCSFGFHHGSSSTSMDIPLAVYSFIWAHDCAVKRYLAETTKNMNKKNKNKNENENEGSWDRGTCRNCMNWNSAAICDRALQAVIFEQWVKAMRDSLRRLGLTWPGRHYNTSSIVLKTSKEAAEEEKNMILLLERLLLYSPTVHVFRLMRASKELLEFIAETRFANPASTLKKTRRRYEDAATEHCQRVVFGRNPTSAELNNKKQQQ